LARFFHASGGQHYGTRTSQPLEAGLARNLTSFQGSRTRRTIELVRARRASSDQAGLPAPFTAATPPTCRSATTGGFEVYDISNNNITNAPSPPRVEPNQIFGTDSRNSLLSRGSRSVSRKDRTRVL
jgi:hypothetical protein